MKKFILNISIFTIVFLLLISFSIIIIGKFHQFQPSEMYYFNEFEEAYRTRNSKVLAIGNSKLLSALDKTILEENNQHKVSILGYSSANISVSKLTLESYLNNCSTLPELVILEVSWFTFNTDRTQMHAIVGDLLLRDPCLWINYFNYSPMSLLKKTMSSSGKVLLNHIKNKPIKNELSYATRFNSPSPLTKNYDFSIEEMEVIFPDHIAGIDKILLKDFYSIVDLCNKNSIDLILFTAPEDSLYVKSQKDRNEIKQIFNSTANANTNIFYLDYTLDGDLWDNRYENWLDNSHHINENDLFTKKFISDMKARTHNNVYF